MLVPLANGRGTAVLTASDFELLKDRLPTSNWFINKKSSDRQYVCCRQLGGSCLVIARVILDARCEDRVVYRDGDPLNLRPENLVLLPKRRRGE